MNLATIEEYQYFYASLGEHASCGPNLHSSGFTYDPADFMKADIFFYNFAWKDFGEATMAGLLDMVKVLSFALSEGKVAVHCHAGLGRTGVLIAAYLVYYLRVRSNDALRYVRLKRPGAVQTRKQIECVKEFEAYFLPQVGFELHLDLGICINLKSADKELKAVTPEKSKTCATAFTKKLVTTFQLSKARSGHFFLE